MVTIDKAKPVLVTGANGYVASWIVKKLLEQGITVHAAVRNPDNIEKVGHLRMLATQTEGTLHFFKADLMKPHAYKEAMEGCELVYHTASPFSFVVKDPIKDLIDPARKGTENVLKSASEVESVRRIVLTSSVAAIYTDAIDCKKASEGALTEEIWNTTASKDYQPYSYSKTVAEKVAWEIAKKQNQWDLVVINPSFVLGPSLNPKNTTSDSFNILKMFGNGELKMGAPRMGVAMVDVRDVAEAHFRAGYMFDAQGRYITSARNTDFVEMAAQLLPKFGDQYPIPRKALPKWLLILLGPMANKLYTRKFVRNNVNVPINIDNSKIKKDLKMSFRPIKETLEDTFELLIAEGAFS